MRSNSAAIKSDAGLALAGMDVRWRE